MPTTLLKLVVVLLFAQRTVKLAPVLSTTTFGGLLVSKTGVIFLGTYKVIGSNIKL